MILGLLLTLKVMLYVIKRRVVTITFCRLDCENRRIDFMKYFITISIQLKILYILNCYIFFLESKEYYKYYSSDI